MVAAAVSCRPKQQPSSGVRWKEALHVEKWEPPTDKEMERRFGKTRSADCGDESPVVGAKMEMRKTGRKTSAGADIVQEVPVRCENCDSRWQINECMACGLPYCDKCSVRMLDYDEGSEDCRQVFACLGCIVHKDQAEEQEEQDRVMGMTMHLASRRNF